MTPKPDEELRLPLWEHLEELRNILIRSLLALSVGAIAAYCFCDEIVKFLERPLIGVLPEGQRHLYFTGVADKFLIYFKVSLLSSLILTGPFLLYQAWLFISPGLYRHERRFVGAFIAFGSLTFLLGLVFAYYIVIPYGYKFLIEFGGENDLPIITLKAYFDLTLKLMVAVGLLFEMPVLIVLLGKFGIVTPEILTKYRRHAMLAISVVSALVTPSPDAITLVMVMIPLYLLYEISIFAVRLTNRGKTTEPNE